MRTIPTRHTGVSALYGILCGTLVSLSAVTYGEVAHAKIFKCLEADGSTSYNQMPCPEDAKVEEVIGEKESDEPTKTASNTNSACNIANNFARASASQMLGGTSSGDIFAGYGGVDAMPRSSIGVISFVFSHKGKSGTSVDSITKASADRCETGSYGSLTCKDFPTSFISSLGGCEQAAEEGQFADMPATSTSTEASSTAAGDVPTPALAVKVDKISEEEKCKLNNQARIKDIDRQLGRAEGEDLAELKQRKSDLQRTLSNC